MSRPRDRARPCFVGGSEGRWLLAVWVQPGASRDGVVGEYRGCLKISLAAQAVDNKANKALIAFLARALNLKRGVLAIEAGRTGRKKQVALRVAAEPDWRVLSAAPRPE